jgi:SnoaL-like domain
MAGEMDVNADTQRWVDKNELAELVAVLASAVDRADRERIVSCYAEDSTDDHGSFKGSGRAFADYICDSDLFTFMHHLIGQSVFDVTAGGLEAWGETYFAFQGGVGANVVRGCGRYVDYFVKVDGRWKVKYRRVVPDLSPPGDDPGAYWPASRDRADPSYDRRTGPDDQASDSRAEV